MQIIINAGGTGTRLWPLSTNKNPKQFVKLIDEQNFVQKTFERLSKKFDTNQIWLSTNQKFQQLAQESLPSNFLSSHLLLENEKRDTFASILAQTAVVAHFVGKNEPLIFIASDHLIDDNDWEKFNSGLLEMAKTLQTDDFELVIAGIVPTFANTELGYIEIAADIHKSENRNSNQKTDYTALKVASFREKPDLATAEEFLKSENFLWNLGYFATTYDILLQNLTKHNPELVGIVTQIYEKGQITPELYSQIPKNSIDFALVEKLTKIGAVKMEIEWQDIGNWDIVKNFLPNIATLDKPNFNKNVENSDKKKILETNLKSQKPNFVQTAGKNNKVKSQNNRRIALIGVSNLLVVESDDGILVIDPSHAPLVKKAVEYFEEG